MTEGVILTLASGSKRADWTVMIWGVSLDLLRIFPVITVPSLLPDTSHFLYTCNQDIPTISHTELWVWPFKEGTTIRSGGGIFIGVETSTWSSKNSLESGFPRLVGSWFEN
ncbi:uncharacterized protein H6S33_004434 [Morchella sextelata]|uniref:uncharacterized protein n=1 Tax=Morchella sextelata TaxID=1174677 RepID=UPI001D056E3C|nr:uncharacterized protein H6S33_004434 [Morchella sextelata]KAH0605977.1 hypothetical protein H6S33_004434 [Morchella sextelata]